MFSYKWKDKYHSQYSCLRKLDHAIKDQVEEKKPQTKLLQVSHLINLYTFQYASP